VLEGVQTLIETTGRRITRCQVWLGGLLTAAALAVGLVRVNAQWFGGFTSSIAALTVSLCIVVALPLLMEVHSEQVTRSSARKLHAAMPFMDAAQQVAALRILLVGGKHAFG
jgi:hypothetical protein